MPSMLMTGIEVALGGGLTFDIQPAVGEAYLITELFADPAFENDLPDVSWGLIDAVNALCIGLVDPNTLAQKQYRPKEIYISNTTWLRVTNQAAGASNIGYSGHRVSPDIVMTQIVVAPNGATVDVQPPAGQTWRVTEIACEVLNASNWPDITVNIINATLFASLLCSGASDLVWPKLLDWYIDNDTYLRFAPIAGADRAVGLSIVRVPMEAFCDVVDVVGSATLDIQPDVGVEAVITAFSAEQWSTLLTAGSPDMTISLWDETNLSDIAEAGSVSDSLIYNRRFAIEIDNDIYIRITEVSTNPNEIGYLGYVRRRYNT